MHSLSKNPIQPPGLLQNIFVELASTVTAVVAYQPLRTVAISLVTQTEIKLKPSILYRGFSFNLLCAHQLFVMGTINKFLNASLATGDNNSMLQKVFIAAISGGFTTLSTTPLEFMMLQKQLKNSQFNFMSRACYRGIAPMGIRQMGLGVGMFVLPEMIAEQARQFVPEFCESHQKIERAISGFSGGVIASTVTQLPEVARTLMQADIHSEKYPSNSKAFKAAWQQIHTKNGIRAYFARLAVLAVATAVLTASREGYSQMLDSRRAA